MEKAVSPHNPPAELCRGVGMPRCAILRHLSGINRRRDWRNREKAPLCRGSCHGNAVTEGVYVIDTVKPIVR